MKNRVLGQSLYFFRFWKNLRFWSIISYFSPIFPLWTLMVILESKVHVFTWKSSRWHLHVPCWELSLISHNFPIHFTCRWANLSLSKSFDTYLCWIKIWKAHHFHHGLVFVAGVAGVVFSIWHGQEKKRTTITHQTIKYRMLKGKLHVKTDDPILSQTIVLLNIVKSTL